MAEKSTYVMVPKRIIKAWIIVSILLFIMNMASFQYTNYVDRRSNQFLCAIIITASDAYKTAPPSSRTGQLLAVGYDNAIKGFKCR